MWLRDETGFAVGFIDVARSGRRCCIVKGMFLSTPSTTAVRGTVVPFNDGHEKKKKGKDAHPRLGETH
jgi:hypothetical protein